MLENYFSIFIFISLGIVIGFLPIVMGWLFSPHEPNPVKLSAYECGFEPFESARLPFDVRYYLVAILFILFDLETAFLFPWAIAIRKIGWFGIAAMGLFMGLLLVGFFYEWKKGALEWD
ncbi:MAG: NAD(P)H-quinone oxidoreductase subunit 3 [Legionellaceae bacterium]